MPCSIRKAIPLNAPKPVIAVKFINKEHAYRIGNLRPKQLQYEINIHKVVGESGHDNIVRFLSWGDDRSWTWIAMELAEGGDLFDKIEADEGVGEDIAHFYFKQLINAVAWCHGKGVAHRDIKPENMLLTGDGDLKLADFGLATVYLNTTTGARKTCGMVCGSPPYIAPEIILVGTTNQKRKASGGDKLGYAPNVADIWSCAIVLFVLLVGNTPWDVPIAKDSEEFHEFLQTEGRPQDELWDKVPLSMLSLLRGMLRVDETKRFTIDDIRIHPWFMRPNAYMSKDGKAANAVTLATSMIERLRIDFDAQVPSSQTQSQARSQKPADPMDLDSSTQPTRAAPAWTSHFAATQPTTPIADLPFEWEAPSRPGLTSISASQPTTSFDRSAALATHTLAEQLSQDPSMSQFAPTPSVPMSRTQAARHFKDIMPSHSLTRFYSIAPLPQLLPLLVSSLHQLGIPVPALPQQVLEAAGKEEKAQIRIKTTDGRKQGMSGTLLVERIGDGLVEVRFVKAKGDPLEWRRLFKRVVVLCKDVVVRLNE